MLVFFIVLALSVVGIAWWLIRSGQRPHQITVALALAGVALLSEHWNVRLTSNLQISISALFRVFAAVALGPLSAAIVASVSMLGYLRRPYLRWAIYTCSDSITAMVSGIVAVWAAGRAQDAFAAVVLATISAVLVGCALDTGFCAGTMRLRRTATLSASMGELLPLMASTVLLHAAVVMPLAYAYLHISRWSLTFFLLPAFAAQRLFVMYRTQLQLATDLGEVNGRLEHANLSFAAALVAALDARDQYTAGHSAAVAVHVREMAGRIGLSAEEQQLAHLAGLLHDIGKIGVPPSLLEKPGPLTLNERQLMENHSIIGERILSNVDAYSEVARVVRHHHERIDGKGYPDGLEGIAIPALSRIIAIVDAYNAMTSDRPYRGAMSHPVAIDQLRQASGTQFDAKFVELYEEMLQAWSAYPPTHRASDCGIHLPESQTAESAQRLAA